MILDMLSLAVCANGIILDPAEAHEQAPALRWPVEKASKLEQKLSKVRGANYLASNCVNTTQMWEQFDSLEEIIDRELGYSQKAGLNSIRVFIQYIVYEAYPDDLVRRLGRLLDIADSHDISVMPTLFDDCWRPEPQLGEQPEPIPSVHNCCWTSSPGEKRTNDPAYYPRLAEYVKALVSAFRTDERIVAWEPYNEPNRGRETLLPLAFMWARECDPVQPLVTCFGGNPYSDVITDHHYKNPTNEQMEELKASGRPVMVTECLARPHNNLADFIPVYERHKVGWYIWEAMIGEDQTRFPWGTKPNSPEPEAPFHGLIYPDGKPYSQDEVKLILELAKRQGDTV